MLKKVKDIWTSENTKNTVILYVVAAIIVNFIVECLARKNIFGGFIYLFQHPIVFVINMMIIIATLCITLLMKRRLFGILLISFIWICIGVIDFIIVLNRTTPFTAVDIGMGAELIGILDKYTTPFIRVVIILVVVACVVAMVGVWKFAPKVTYKIPYLYNVCVIVVIYFSTALSISVGLETKLLSTKFANLTLAYENYGLPYTFGTSIFKSGVSKPKNYSKEKIQEIKHNIEENIEKETTKENNTSSDDNDKTEEVKQTPNIIFLQLESFFDVSKVKDLELSEDPIPYFNQLKEEFPSGYLSVHNVGYGTANTEFEIMTGMNLDDFGPGEFPYKTVLNDTTCESMAYNLKENGYATHAMHNNTGTFYNRDFIFSQLGYDTYTSLEYMNNIEKTPIGWAKDKILTDEIIKVLDSTECQDYLYAISVQGHGSYPTEPTYENPVITVEGGIDNEGRVNAVEFYVNEIREMDDFIRDLTAKLSAYDEDIILVMYGDHLPSLGFSGEDLENGSEFQTEYIVWNNMNIQMEDEDIEAFQLSSKICEYLGINNGVINKYHQTQKDSEEYLNGLQNLTFDIFSGNKSVYDGENPYIATEMQMGTTPITITGIEIDNAVKDEHIVYIVGEGFTTYSKVFINGEKVQTAFVNETRLRIRYEDLKPDDVFEVKQMYGEKNILSVTDGFIYYGDTTQESNQDTVVSDTTASDNQNDENTIKETNQKTEEETEQETTKKKKAS